MASNLPFNLEQQKLTRIVCAVVFCLFTFMYLYFYQAEIVAVAQHILSEGKTTYHRFVGAVIVTATLYALQVFVLKYTQLNKRAHAVTYMPSLLVLTFISSIGSRADQHFSYGAWPWAAPLCLMLFGVLVWAAKQLEPYEPDNTVNGFVDRVVWINLMLLALQFIIVACCANHDEVFHYRMKMEKCIMKGDYDAALKVGRKALAADSSLTMLRAHALAASGQLNERFFDYPVVGGAEALRTNGTSVRTVLLPDSIVTAMADSSAAAVDFKLMALLLDRKLEAFADEVAKHYPDSMMPKIYDEAMLQYRYSTGQPINRHQEDDSDWAREADFQGFNEMRNTIEDPQERYTNLRRVYGNTYWFYYRYGK